MEAIQPKENVIKKIKLRKIRGADYKQIVQLQLRCFPGMKPWKETQFKNLITFFPEGQLCILIENQIIASCSSLIINFENYSETPCRRFLLEGWM